MKPLTRCPQCKYSLTGLPAQHRCPECGLFYDLNSRVWRNRFPKKSIVVPICCTAVVLAFVVTAMIRGYSQSSIVVLLEAIAIPLGVVGSLLLVRDARHGLLVATLPEGLFVRIGKPTGVLYPWEDIEHVFWDSTKKISGVTFSDINRPLYFHGILKKQSDFEDLAIEVRRRKQAQEGESCSGS